VKRTIYEAHYVVFSSLPPLPPSKFQIFSTTSSETPSIYVIPLMERPSFALV